PHEHRFELRGPLKGSGRLLSRGRGGPGGPGGPATGRSHLPPGTPPPLAAGFAVVSFDGGHEGSDAEFGLDPKAKTDFAYHSMDIAAATAKALIAQYYGQGPRRSYFAGCSNRRPPGMT